MSDPLERCPLTAAVEIIGGKWTLIVLYALSRQPRRFNELQRLAPGISHKVLTQTVRALENHGLVVREVGDTAVPCVRYSLSDDGAVIRKGVGGVCNLAPADGMGLQGVGGGGEQEPRVVAYRALIPRQVRS